MNIASSKKAILHFSENHSGNFCLLGFSTRRMAKCKKAGNIDEIEQLLSISLLLGYVNSLDFFSHDGEH